jgi:hypothetical protein
MRAFSAFEYRCTWESRHPPACINSISVPPASTLSDDVQNVNVLAGRV